ncbi:MAG: hydantoinase/oxoprolinase family protein [Desulfobacteraceae bacterium]
MDKRFRLAVDTGGTFTDLCVVDQETGSLAVTKVPSTPANPALAVIEGVEKLVQEGKITAEGIQFLLHGTTVATNALLEHKGAETALITTKGFEDILQIGRQNRPDLYDFWARRPPPIVPRRLAYGVEERILYTGEVHRPLDETGAEAVIKEIKKKGVGSIAVSLLHSYANPIHEKKLLSIIERIHPEAYVTLSSDVLPEFREYERTSTICINSFVMPKVNNYVEFLDGRLRELGVASELYIMQSNGGVITAEMAREMSARTVLSGPAGGVLTGVLLSGSTEYKNVITIDIGGTSSDISLIEKGIPRLTTESQIGGYPIKLPMIDINTIGAGGGSIAWIDSGGALRVGPHSAGADPGPVCYGRGGTEPTATDANAILGRINPTHLLGGEMEMHLEKAYQAVEEKIARPLGMDTQKAAEGIIAVMNANMIRGIRRVSVEQGYDPRDFALVGFGGAGPLHAVELAQALNMLRIVIPPHPGIASAFGMLSADVRHDYVQTNIVTSEKADVASLQEVYQSLEREGEAQLRKEGFDQSSIVLERRADMRYSRQAYELQVPMKSGDLDPKALRQAVEAFHREHEKTYGHARRNEPVELVNLRVVAWGKLPEASLEESVEGSVSAPEPFAHRKVVFKGASPVETPIYQREALLSGQRVVGPAVMEQLDSTILVFPDYEAVADPYGNLVITAEGESK